MVIQRELAWRAENERFGFFRPNAPSQKLLDIVGTGRDTVGIFSAANGVGKTTLVVNLLANIIWGAQSEWFKKPTFSSWSFPKRIRFVTDPKLVEEIGPFHSEVKKWWPRGRYDAIKAGHNFYSQYKALDWIIDVMTYDQEIRQFEGGTMGMIIFDEPPPRDIWNASIARLRLGGILLVTMTPLTHAAWFFDEVVPRHTESVVYATMEDACKEHGVNGHLEHAHIQNMIAEMPPEEVEARAYGRALYLAGLIFKDFDPRIHVLKETVVPPANATIYQVVDPHEDKPFACIWAMVDGKGDLTIVDEWPNVDFYKWHGCKFGIKEYAEIFQGKEQGLQIHKRIIDRHFAEISHMVGHTRKTLRDQFREEAGLEFHPSYQAKEEVDSGIIRVHDYLRYSSDRPLDWNNKPKLFINPHCQNTIKSLARWARDPKTSKPQEAYKDFCDVVRYLVMDSPQIDVPLPYEPAQKRWG